MNENYLRYDPCVFPWPTPHSPQDNPPLINSQRPFPNRFYSDQEYEFFSKDNFPMQGNVFRNDQNRLTTHLL